MKIRKPKITELYIILIAICMTNFLGFYKYLPLGTTLFSTDFQHLCILVVSLFFFLIICLEEKKVSISKGRYWYLIISMICLVLIEIVWSYERYHQPIFSVVKEGIYYIVPLFAFLVYLKTKNIYKIEVEEICNILVKLSIIASLIAIIAFILYTYMGINLLQLADKEVSNFRYGTIRFGVGGMIVLLSMIISLTKVLDKVYKRIDIVNLILASIQLIVINKTRTRLIYMIMLVCIILIMSKQVSKIVKIFLTVFVITCAIYIFFYIDLVSNTLTNYVNQDVSIKVRFDTISFYMEQFKKVPVLGMGFISPNKNFTGWKLLYGDLGYYYRSDVGVVGLLNELGICGALWSVMFFRFLWSKMKNIQDLYARIVRYMVIYFIITLINLSFLDNGNIMCIFIAMVISDAVLDSHLKEERRLIQ